MSGFEELESAYKEMSEYGFRFSKIIPDINPYDESYELVFEYNGIEINMSFSYQYIVENGPLADDLIFTGDPVVHFSVYGYRVITEFIQALQRNRLDKDTMETFIDYLESQK